MYVTKLTNEALFSLIYCTGHQTIYNNIFNVFEDKTNSWKKNKKNGCIKNFLFPFCEWAHVRIIDLCLFLRCFYMISELFRQCIIFFKISF